MATRFIAYGKKVDNLRISIENKIIGSEFTTFSEKVAFSDIIVFVCDTRVWGTASIESEVFYSTTKLWRDKVYPYRAQIDHIQILKNPFHLDEFNFNSEFRDHFGKGWAFKILFTPGAIPDVMAKRIIKVIEGQAAIPKNEQLIFLTKEAESARTARKKQLGLT